MAHSRKTSCVPSAALAAAILFGGTMIAGAHEKQFTAGEPGNPAEKSRTVEIILTEEFGASTYKLERIGVRRGEKIRFVLHNTGKEMHEFVLATTKDNLKHAAEMRKNPHMKHNDPNARTLKPGQSAELLWHFTKRGTFEYAHFLPGHREEGMVGIVVVK